MLDTIAMARVVAEWLRAGLSVYDCDFDALLPVNLRSVSGTYWTPVTIARRAATLLTQSGATRVLDVGAGPGKLCSIGALTTHARFTGLEQRAHLVDAGRTLVSMLGVEERATFVHGKLEDIDFHAFDAFYFFNPFAENLFTHREWLDTSVEISERRILEDVCTLEYIFPQLRIGTRLVTYNGLGWRIPNCFDLIATEAAGGSRMRSWVKTRMTFDGFHSDFSDETALWASRALRSKLAMRSTR